MNRNKVFDAFRNCITEPKCRNCPWEQCEQFNQKKVEIPVTLALDVINLLKEREAVKPKSKVRHGANAQIQHFCGNCNSMLHGKPKFCSECGKGVLWRKNG